MYSLLTDRQPKVDIMPKREDQVWKARLAQDTVEHVMESQKAYRAMALMKRDGLLYGNGFMKIIMVDGKPEFTVPSIYTTFVDPLSTSIDDASSVIFATPTYVDKIREMFPGKADKIQGEGRLDEYRSFIKNDTSQSYATDKVNL